VLAGTAIGAAIASAEIRPVPGSVIEDEIGGESNQNLRLQTHELQVVPDL
jgi:hypothetical protein